MLCRHSCGTLQSPDTVLLQNVQQTEHSAQDTRRGNIAVVVLHVATCPGQLSWKGICTVYKMVHDSPIYTAETGPMQKLCVGRDVTA